MNNEYHYYCYIIYNQWLVESWVRISPYRWGWKTFCCGITVQILVQVVRGRTCVGTVRCKSMSGEKVYIALHIEPDARWKRKPYLVLESLRQRLWLWLCDRSRVCEIFSRASQSISRASQEYQNSSKCIDYRIDYIRSTGIVQSSIIIQWPVIVFNRIGRNTPLEFRSLQYNPL